MCNWRGGGATAILSLYCQHQIDLGDGCVHNQLSVPIRGRFTYIEKHKQSSIMIKIARGIQSLLDK